MLLMLPLLLRAVAYRLGLFQLLWPCRRVEGRHCPVTGFGAREEQVLLATDLKPHPRRHP